MGVAYAWASPLLAPPPSAQEEVRLVNSNTMEGSQYKGHVEVRHNGQWGTVCAHDWSLEDAQVVCRMAGFASVVRQDTTGYYGAGTGQVWLDHVRCSGQEATLDDCMHNLWGVVDASCSDHSMDAGVVCSDGEQPPLQNSVSPSVCLSQRPPFSLSPELALRLVNGDAPSEGRVEIYHGNQWGTICDDGCGFEEALAVCRQLGYHTALRVEP